MRDDICAAAFRLACALPARTHYAPPPAPKPKVAARKSVVNPGTGRGGNNRKALIIDGKQYASIGAARKALRCCIHSIYRMIADGRARYASDADQRMVGLGRSRRGAMRRA